MAEVFRLCLVGAALLSIPLKADVQTASLLNPNLNLNVSVQYVSYEMGMKPEPSVTISIGLSILCSYRSSEMRTFFSSLREHPVWYGFHPTIQHNTFDHLSFRYQKIISLIFILVSRKAKGMSYPITPTGFV